MNTKKNKKKTHTTVITNRRARFDYELNDSYTAGLILTGQEVKSARMGTADLRGSYVSIKNGEALLVGSYIAPYRQAAPDPNYDPNRTRKLLLKQAELDRLLSAKQNKLTIVPVRMLVSRRFIKIEISTARGLKKYDNRQKDLRKQQIRETRKRLH